MAPDGHVTPFRWHDPTRVGAGTISLGPCVVVVRALLCIIAVRRDIRLAGAAALASLLVFAYGVLLDQAGAGSTASLLMLTVFAAAAISSVAGFAFSALCGALLFHLPMGQVQIVQTMMVCSIAIQLLSISVLRRSISWTYLPVFLAGGLVGLPVGLSMLLLTDKGTFSLIIGLLLCSYSGIMLSGRRRVITRQSRILDFLIGVCGGVTGGASAFPGAPVTVWCQMKGWTRDQQRGVFQPFILVMQVAALVLMAGGAARWSAGPISWLSWCAVPPALLGAVIGLRCYRGMSDLQFTRLVNAMLLASGSLLVLAP